MSPREFYRTEGKPIEGQSHWCEGYTRWGLRHKCNNIVSNDSDHCAAGHRNKIRQSYPSTKSHDLGQGHFYRNSSPAEPGFAVEGTRIDATDYGPSPATEDLVPVRNAASAEFPIDSEGERDWVWEDKADTPNSAAKSLYESAVSPELPHKISEEDWRSVIGEGIHTGFRKGTDHPQAHDYWKLIEGIPDKLWDDVLAWTVSGLQYMGLIEFGNSNDETAANAS